MANKILTNGLVKNHDLYKPIVNQCLIDNIDSNGNVIDAKAEADISSVLYEAIIGMSVISYDKLLERIATFEEMAADTDLKFISQTKRFVLALDQDRSKFFKYLLAWETLLKKEGGDYSLVKAIIVHYVYDYLQGFKEEER